MKVQHPNIIAGIAHLKKEWPSLLNLPSLSPYNRKYLEWHIKHLEYHLTLNGLILEEALRQKPDVDTIIDYGGGTGMLGILAKISLGVKVIYMDIYSLACRDVADIGAFLALKPDEIIEGDLTGIRAGLNGMNTVLVSRDVIEHIYDLPEFFKKSETYIPGVTQVHLTGANVYNWFKKKYFREIHHRFEIKGDPGKLKETDHVQSFFQMRYDFIRANFPAINDDAVLNLSTLSRGLIFNDIKRFVESWLDGSSLVNPRPEKYMFNTCDPVSGNWSERLLYFEEYRSMASPYFRLNFRGCPYLENQNAKGKSMASRLLNACIGKDGKRFRFLWPSFILTALPNENTPV